jgi:hypothetical protein
MQQLQLCQLLLGVTSVPVRHTAGQIHINKVDRYTWTWWPDKQGHNWRLHTHAALRKLLLGVARVSVGHAAVQKRKLCVSVHVPSGPIIPFSSTSFCWPQGQQHSLYKYG